MFCCMIKRTLISDVTPDADFVSNIGFGGSKL